MPPAATATPTGSSTNTTSTCTNSSGRRAKCLMRRSVCRLGSSSADITNAGSKTRVTNTRNHKSGRMDWRPKCGLAIAGCTPVE
eukprot:scaffold190660_cov17-Tisochrysis_lutea.AAC.2